MFVDEVFVLKLLAIDTFATGAIASCEITTLTHELWDDAMKIALRISKSFFASAESSEILACLRCIAVQIHDNATRGIATDRDVEITLANNAWRRHDN